MKILKRQGGLRVFKTY